ncbi:hypothetical protein K435DRAFT_971984 [Dendrothele bispora CBS 962.96]|uniref:Uncharacterized protein n=1 Tax=Dendrothele bispora (strain CBS 962.96) TaxID=1314807 RepID=A0A4V4HC89_DENBC|nr:hypothetical protein K435DRAFT_971984 [Dendrothele bispora CBS 962.96]
MAQPNIPLMTQSLQSIAQEIEKFANILPLDLQAQFEALQGQLGQVQGQLDQVQGQHDQVQGQLGQMQGQLTTIEKRLDNLVAGNHNTTIE